MREVVVVTYEPRISDEQFARDLAEREARRGTSAPKVGTEDYWRLLAFEYAADAQAAREGEAAAKRALALALRGQR